jgi:LPXTG-site transpeptidase (sortase) family protein
MYIKQRYGYLFALLFLVGCVALGGWAWSSFSLPLQQDNHLQQENHPIVTPNAQNIVTPDSQPYLNMDTNAHLLIPAIGVDAPIEPVGVTSDRVLNVPQKNQWTGVGWYKDGPVPGQAGSAVIDGHLDRPGGVPAVFWKLNQLHIGDMVTVIGTPSKALHFQVVQVQAYQPNKAPLEKIYGDTSGRYLNLITCAGEWIPSRHQTAERLVVYTKLVS